MVLAILTAPVVQGPRTTILPVSTFITLLQIILVSLVLRWLVIVPIVPSMGVLGVLQITGLTTICVSLTVYPILELRA